MLSRLGYLLALLLPCFMAGCSQTDLTHGNMQNFKQSLLSRPLSITDINFDIAPQGDAVLFSGQGQGDAGIYLLSLKNNKVQRVIDTPSYETTPAFAPDGKSIVYAAATAIQKPCRIFTCTLNGTGITPITQLSKKEEAGPVYDICPAVSVDGSEIVFARATRNRPYSMGGMTWDNWDIFTVKPDGTGLRRVTTGNYHAVSPPRFSPDGKRIIFAATVAGTGAYDPSAPAPNRVPHNVLLVDSQGDEQPRLLTKDDRSSSPSFMVGDAVHANQVVFISDQVIDFEYELWLMHEDGTRQRQLIQTHAQNTMPRFTPDGQHIFFIHNAPGQQFYELWEIDVSGSNLHQIADSSLFSDPLHWRPSK